MPPKVKVTKEQIIDATFLLVRKEGKDKLHARTIAKALNVSTQPIFSCFHCMDDLIKAVKEKALEVYHQYMIEGMKSEKPFKGTGIKYIQFAKDEPHLFRFLFMDNVLQDYKNVMIESIENQNTQTELIQKVLNCSYQDAKLVQLESWIFVHGIATMIVTQTIHFDDEIISCLLSDFYKGTKRRLTNGSN